MLRDISAFMYVLDATKVELVMAAEKADALVMCVCATCSVHDPNLVYELPTMWLEIWGGCSH